MRASAEALDSLHALLAGALKDELTAALELAKDPDPEKRRPVNPQLIDKVLKFLKDNGIDTPAKSARVTNLAEQLAAVDLEQEAALLPN